MSRGRLWAQHDRGPGIRAKEPTTSWLPGEVVLDPVDLTLPPGLRRPIHPNRMGMYLAPNGPRLQRLDAAGSGR